ncbi:MAG: hypothetical protein ACOVSW_10510 [Candidatus Kapaibacteriota bacterium]
MNQLDYVVAITEDADTLFTLERQARHPKERQRLQLLRLLKSGLAMTHARGSCTRRHQSQHRR